MADITVKRDSKLIKVLAAQVRNERVDSDKIEEAAQICSEMLKDLNPQSAHQIAQTVAFTVDELQEKSLDFLGTVADIKNVSFNEKAAFKVKDYSIKSVIQAKGATTPRSYVADHQILVDTEEISARPAMNIIDLLSNRVNMSDLIKEANDAMTNMKLKKIERVLHASISKYGSPWYAKSTGGLNQSTLDAQLAHFFRLGPVSILGDFSAVGQIAPFTGMAVNPTSVQFSGSMLDENNANGFIGNYRGAKVISMNNAYDEDGVTPILSPNWLYIIPGGQSNDARNLKIVNEGSVQSMSAQDINDRAYEILLYSWFGVAFVTGKNPTSGAHELG